jgi:hypothetical protein
MRIERLDMSGSQPITDKLIDPRPDRIGADLGGRYFLSPRQRGFSRTVKRKLSQPRIDHSVRDFMETFKMASTYLAQINPSDYEMIRGILKDETDLQRRGQTISHIEIDPDEIARYCGAHGGHRSHHGLLHFVIKKSQGENY